MATTTDDKEVLKLDQIIVSPKGLTESDGGRVALLFVPSTDVDYIVPRFGGPEHRPVVSLVIGTILAAAGVVGLASLAHSFKGLRYKLGTIAFGLIGASLIFDALKKRHFLEVHHKKGITRLVFSGKVRPQEIKDFCEKVRSIYGYQISEGVHPETR